MSLKKIFSYFFDHLKSFFFKGLFTILPVILTIFIISITYDFITRWLKPLRELEPYYLQAIPGSEIILVTIFLLCLGFFLKLVFITPIVHWVEHFIAKIPFIRTVYGSTKTLVDFFNVSGAEKQARKVVLIEFPRKGVFNIGFLLDSATNDFQKLLPAEKQKPNTTYFRVFMPNSPNPTSGYFLILAEDDIIPTNLTFDEAIKAVVSCGLITPDSLKNL